MFASGKLRHSGTNQPIGAFRVSSRFCTRPREGTTRPVCISCQTTTSRHWLSEVNIPIRFSLFQPGPGQSGSVEGPRSEQQLVRLAERRKGRPLSATSFTDHARELIWCAWDVPETQVEGAARSHSLRVFWKPSRIPTEGNAMRALRVYADTSVFGGIFDEECDAASRRIPRHHE